jgi:hypothetical protein
MKRISPENATALRLLAIAVALISGNAHGQATVDPDTQPFMTLAPYVLKSTNLEPRIGNEEGGTRAYRPWFENGAWTGDLIEYEITKDGVRLVRTDTGRYPRDGADWRGTGPLWSARYAFPDFKWYDATQELGPDWECMEEDNYQNFWRNRKVFTVRGGVQVNFLWDQLSAAQRLALDPTTPADNIDPFASPILNYVRGDRSNERCKAGGTYRWRFSVLGAIVNSRPAFVPAGDSGLVVVGANDGMLHGFDATNGTETFAYVPSMLINKVGQLRRSPYRPTYFVDGELRHADIGTVETPRHIVTGGLGAGGKGVYVMDVSTPTAPAVVLELSGTTAGHIGGTYRAEMGHVHGRPTIARLPVGGGSAWFAVSGNGYKSDAGTAQLVLIPLGESTPTPSFVATDGTAGNGLSAPALVDATGNGVVDYGYAGDLKGNLWRFNFNTSPISVTKLFSAGANKPITVEPDIARHPDMLDGFMVYFGTGSLLSAADAELTSEQTIYGIWDRNGVTVDETRLVTQSLATGTAIWQIPQDNNLCGTPSIVTSEASVRVIDNPQGITWTGANPNLGWRVHLPRPGERLIGRPQVRAERVQFITTNPYDMADPSRMASADSGSWIMQLDLASGANAKLPRSLFDLNKNCTLDTDDGLPSGHSIGTVPAGTYPVGVNVGAFNVAQPAFARVRFDSRVRSVVDGVYINALQMPPPVIPGERAPLPQIDVTTDSHYGPAHRKGPEPEKSGFSGVNATFADSSGPTKPYIRQDGLGHRVDGHAFGYNYHHDVDFVDFFDLEPQRDVTIGEPPEPPGWRLDIGAQFRDTDGTFKLLNDPPRKTHQELNRVTEVNIGPNQKFIIMVTNADLSQSVKIQIGCEHWDVYDYQTMMMGYLKTGAIPPGLVFTLDGSHNPIRPTTGSLSCLNRDWDNQPMSRTLRLTPTRVQDTDDFLGTRPGCVNNTDYYEAGGSPTDRPLTRKSTQLNPDGSFSDKTSIQLYADSAHVTRNQEGTGWRWRNGALTVQLLAINDDFSWGFTIQDVGLPTGAGTEGVDLGWGGAFAKAFTLDGTKVVPITSGVSPPAAAAPVSGMLYELSTFWHWGDMARFQQEGTPSAHCYGAKQLVSALKFETEQFAAGFYQQLVKNFDEALQKEYLQALQDLQDPALAEAALIRLAAMFKADPKLAIYHRLRPYVSGAKQLQGHPNLILIDRGGLDLLADDGTPVDVLDIERDLLPSLGPNYQPGRRSWMDLTPE